VFVSNIRSTALPLGVALATLLEVYGVSDRNQAIMQHVSDLMEASPATPPVPQTAEELMKLKVVDLKAILKSSGQKVGGKKADLVDRIINSTAKAQLFEEPKLIVPTPTEVPQPDVVPMTSPDPKIEPIQPTEALQLCNLKHTTNIKNSKKKNINNCLYF
jgi:hypothetical protein